MYCWVRCCRGEFVEAQRAAEATRAQTIVDVVAIMAGCGACAVLGVFGRLAQAGLPINTAVVTRQDA